MRPDLSGIQPVLLCGGLGSRLYPLSTPEKPKPYLNLISDDLSLLQETALRLKGAGDPVILCHEDHIDLSLQQLDEADVKTGMVIAEPMRKNTAPAVALATYTLADDTDPLLLFLPCDHQIKDVEAFHAALEKAENAAKKEAIVLFAEKPHYAETGYGYISVEGESDGGVARIASFHEKPQEQVAKKYIRGGYLWNTGIVMARASVLEESFKKYAPDIWENVSTPDLLAERRLQNHSGIMVLSAALSIFQSMPNISFDVAILEECDHLECVPVSMKWADIGRLDTLKGQQERYKVH